MGNPDVGSIKKDAYRRILDGETIDQGAIARPQSGNGVGVEICDPDVGAIKGGLAHVAAGVKATEKSAVAGAQLGDVITGSASYPDISPVEGHTIGAGSHREALDQVGRVELLRDRWKRE